MQAIKTDKRNVAQVAPATIAAFSPAEVSPHGDTLPAPALRPMRWDGVEELTYTEGAMIEALRRLRRAETDPAARAAELAFAELRFATDLDADGDLGGYLEGHPHADLLEDAISAISAYITAKADWLAEHPAG